MQKPQLTRSATHLLSTEEPRKAEAENHIDIRGSELSHENKISFDPFRAQSRSFLEWLFSSIHFNFITAYILSFAAANEKIPSSKAKNNLFMTILKMTYGFDGLDPVSNEVTAANGEKRILKKYSLLFLLTSFFGLSNRPARFDKEGNPILTWGQFFSNMVGGWTLTRDTWNRLEILELPFKFGLVLPIKLLRIFFNIPLNTLKLFTEGLSILLNGLLAVITFIPVELLKYLYNSNYNRLFKALFGLVMIAISLSFIAVQYAAMWVVRIGIALTSPAKSVQFAFALGRSLKIDWWGENAERRMSYVVGILGVVVSVLFTAVLWTLAFPIIVSAVTTFIPGIVPALLWFSHLPWISATMAWASQLPILTTILAAGSSVFTPVGVLLGTLFGPLITTLAGLIGVHVTAMTMLVGTTLGFSLSFVGIAGSLFVEKFSALWIHWHVGLKPNAAKNPSEEEIPLLGGEGESADSHLDLQSEEKVEKTPAPDLPGQPAENSVSPAEEGTPLTPNAISVEGDVLASMREVQRREFILQSYMRRLEEQTPSPATGAVIKEDTTPVSDIRLDML